MEPDLCQLLKMSYSFPSRRAPRKRSFPRPQLGDSPCPPTARACTLVTRVTCGKFSPRAGGTKPWSLKAMGKKKKEKFPNPNGPRAKKEKVPREFWTPRL